MLKPLLCAAGWLIAASALAAQPATIVQTQSGPVLGATEAGTLTWKGIPFAAPPVGALRWRAPRPVTPWRATRDATHYGLDCAQTADAAPGGLMGNRPTSEDCLYLNVWRPRTGQNLPVMVWIYGGGFFKGGSSPALYNGASLARQGVVVVSFNYRLGRFGFFGFPALTAEHPGEPHGNYALMDQIAALRWVHNNIAAFGGDPDQVTIFGQSSGGASVHYLLLNPLARGLFARAIIQSGGGHDGTPPMRTPQAAEQTGIALAQAHGIAATDPAALAKLRALPAAALEDPNDLNFFTPGPTYAGVIDDEQFAHPHWEKLYAAGKYDHVPILIGTTTADGRAAHATSADQLFQTAFGAGAAKARAIYDPQNNAPLAQLNIEVGSDSMTVAPTVTIAEALANTSDSVYLYRFGYVPQSLRAQDPYGAPHASDVAYVFGTLADDPSFKAQPTAADRRVERQMQTLWLQFAKTGTPCAAGVPAWDKFNPAADQILWIDKDGAWGFSTDPWRARIAVTKAVQK